MKRIGRRVQEAKQIDKHLLKVKLIAGQPRTFETELNLDKYDFPSTAKVVLESSCAGSSFVQRFEFGTIKRTAPPKDCSLDEQLGERLRFTLKIIVTQKVLDSSQKIGRIIGIAENIKPINVTEKNLGGRDGILPIVSADLGEQLWRLEFGEHDVVLHINKTIERFSDRFSTDQGIISLVFPAVIREILWKICILDGIDPEDISDSEDEQKESWKAKWIRFAKTFDSTLQETNDDKDEFVRWIDNVVDGFCTEHKFAQSYTKHIEEEES